MQYLCGLRTTSNGYRFKRRRLVWAVAALLTLFAVWEAAAAETVAECSYQGLTQLTDFGSNPGELKGYYFAPEGLPAGAPLVVALHGCGQGACLYDDETGWRQLAQEMKFALLLPEQQDVTISPTDYRGNAGLCFSWWALSGQRDFGEPKSIMNMIRYMVKTFNLDPQRIFITGLSAGGGMTVRMLALYPDCFAAGAPVAGVPYSCAGPAQLSRVASALGKTCMCWYGVNEHDQCVRMVEPEPLLTSEKWGELVRDETCGPFAAEKRACPDTAQGGRWPRIDIWQGAHDDMVAAINLKRLMMQWTNVHGIDPAGGTCVEGAEDPNCIFGVGDYRVERKNYTDNTGTVQVQTNLILGPENKPEDKFQDWAGHTSVVSSIDNCGCLSVDCACERAGEHQVCPTSKRTRYNRDGHICQSRLIAQFWGLDQSTETSATTGAARTCFALQ